MRLSLKLAVLIGIGAALIVLGTSLRSASVDVQLVEQDMRRDAMLIAVIVGKALDSSEHPDEWPLLISDMSEELNQAGVEIQWRPDAEGIAPRTELTATEVVATVPTPVYGGEVVVSESLAPRDAVVSRSLRTAYFTMFSVLLLALSAGLYIGRVLVGRPVEALVALAQRVARGDYSEPVLLSNHDELGVLSQEMNTMSTQLATAQQQARAHAEERLRAQRQLLHADRLRTVGQLAAGIAHEIGTPLSVIAGRAGLVKRELVRAQLNQESAVVIGEQAGQIASLVKRLMNYARPAPISWARFDLHALCAATITLIKPMAGTRELALVGHEDVWMEGSESQIQQVITNLLVNAIHATAPGDRIRVTLIKSQLVVLCVDDEGPGIPKDQREQIFDPFFTTKDPGQGTGLGLSIVHGIVTEHGGSIRCTVSPLGGARFYLTLPATQEDR